MNRHSRYDRQQDESPRRPASVEQGGSGGGFSRREYQSTGNGYGQERPPGPKRYTTVIVGRSYGRSPKGYQRNDDGMREDVGVELYRHPEIDAGGIEVHVDNGKGTLPGKVEDRDQKRLAEDGKGFFANVAPPIVARTSTARYCCTGGTEAKMKWN